LTKPEVIPSAFHARLDVDQPRTDLCHEQDCTVVRLPDGAQVNVYHASGALAVGRRLKPFAHVICPHVDADRLIAHAGAVIKRLDVPASRTGTARTNARLSAKHPDWVRSGGAVRRDSRGGLPGGRLLAIQSRCRCRVTPRFSSCWNMP
jgi:hypothetical protein